MTDQQAENNSAEEESGEKENGMDLEPTEATENPLQTTKSPDDDNAEDNPVESESSSATTVEVKGKLQFISRDQQPVFLIFYN